MLGAHDPARCQPESVFRKLFHITNDKLSADEEPNDNLCDTEPRLCSLGSDTPGNRLNTIGSSKTNSLNSHTLDNGPRSGTSRRKLFNNLETSRNLKKDDYNEHSNSIDRPKQPSPDINDFDAEFRSRTRRTNRFTSKERLRRRKLNSNSFGKDFSSIDSSGTPPQSSNDFNTDLRSKRPLRRLMQNLDKRETDNEKPKRRWKVTNYPAKRFRPGEINTTDLDETHGAKGFDKDRRRRSRRSVVEEVVEGLMEMLDLEVLPVNPKHYGCHDLPFPGLE